MRQDFLKGNAANTTYYNAIGSYGGSARTTTFGIQTTTAHYDQHGRTSGTTRNTAGGW